MTASDVIKPRLAEWAGNLGFTAWGAARVEPLSEEAAWLSAWVERGFHADMAYLARTVDIRRNPSHEGFFPGARTLVMVALPYAHAAPPASSLAAALAAYARGRDYHRVVREKLEKLVSQVEGWAGNVRSRIFVDSAPVMEKAWARRCGVGWIGKNSLVVTPRAGSLVVLGGFVTTLELEPDAPAGDGCGDCDACVRACPTAAIGTQRTVDAGLCLSYLTTQLGRADDEDLARRIAGRSLFGCDLCQEACPSNRRPPAGDEALKPLPSLLGMTVEDLLAMDTARVSALIEGTAMRKLGPGRLLQNARCRAMQPGERSRV
jgi:epoxyqueuosine reductase